MSCVLLLMCFLLDASLGAPFSQELELAIVQANADKSILFLEMEQMKKKHDAEMKRFQQEFKRERREAKVRLCASVLPKVCVCQCVSNH